MKRLARYLLALIVAVLVAEVLGAIAQVQGNIRQQFEPFGIEVSTQEQVSWTLHDIVWLLPSYGMLLAIGFFIAFLVAGLIARSMPAVRPLVFMVAGAAAVLTIFLLAKPVFWGVTPIYGARDLIPMALQGAAGAVGGLVFALMYRRRWA